MVPFTFRILHVIHKKLCQALLTISWLPKVANYLFMFPPFYDTDERLLSQK